MYVVGTCGVFVVGVKFTVKGDYMNTVDAIRAKFADMCRKTYGLRDDEIASVHCELADGNASVVKAMNLIKLYSDALTKHMCGSMESVLKAAINEVYTEKYENELKNKIEQLNNELYK